MYLSRCADVSAERRYGKKKSGTGRILVTLHKHALRIRRSCCDKSVKNKQKRPDGR